MNTFLGLIGGLGGQEMIIIFLIVLLLFGAKKLPELARGVGKSMGEFKKARDDFEREITRSEEDVRRRDEAKAKAEDEIRIREAAGKEPVEKA
jgi:sec-independent protein translocase protein TatA